MTYEKQLAQATLLIVVLLQSTALVLDRNRLPGIWKLVVADRQVLQDLGLYAGCENDDEQEDILLKLNNDGSFRQCNEGYVEGRWMRGCWECDADNRELLLAVDRQYYGKPRDTLLMGRQHQRQQQPDEPMQILIQGKIYMGKFMYPKNHPAFFDAPILTQQEAVGTFRLRQVLSSFALNDGDQEKHEANLHDGPNNDSAHLYTAQDFYGKHFFMTIVPVGQQQGQLENQPADIRAMPIQFFQNNTFSCRGVNKILRGRFVVQNGNKLLFEVSLFGAGRSAPGSVYSEGIGLSHEDKRNYIGTILTEQGSNNKNNSTLRVEGSVTFGSDLGSDARPEPVGKFILKQITPAEQREDDAMKKEDDDFLEDNLFSQAFQ